ncbi:hypothetical protein UPYG_G00091120 [Umbra pygmaea]|uniref:SH2 domain-containing protein n=1 Tax=Umbra pygmaea TaxID=75934 RepID=A0ABD0XFW5_UMBPY
MEPPAGGVEGGEQLVQTWFTHTQAPLLLLQNGQFPDWFQGFSTRSQAEQQLKDKPLGCFLIRLSEKTIGYILSYRGQDRCRHFVINQDQAGQYIISGDDQLHSSLRDLIDHYRVTPIQPFGECLSSTCNQCTSGELYDVIQVGVKFQALRNYWDMQNKHCNGRSDRTQRSDHHRQSDPYRQSDHTQQSDHHHESWNLKEMWKPPTMPPMLPLKPRKLTSTVSTGRMFVPQRAVPPVPRRSLPLTHSLSGTMSAKSSTQTLYALTHHNLNNTTSRSQTLYALTQRDQIKTTSHSQTQYAEIHTIQNKVESLNQGTFPGSKDNTDPKYGDSRNNTSLAAGAVLYSQLTLSDGRSFSQPRLDDTMEEEGDYSFTTPSSYSPSSSKRVTCHTYSFQDSREPPGSNLDQLSTNPLHYASVGLCLGKESPLGPQVQRKEEGGWGPNIKAQQEDTMYAKVPQTPHLFADNTYEQIPGDGGLKGTQRSSAAQQWNTYETLEDLKSQESPRCIKNIPWRKLFPEYKKK